LIGKNAGTNQAGVNPAKPTPLGMGTYVCPSGIRGKDRAVPQLATMLKDNDCVT